MIFSATYDKHINLEMLTMYVEYKIIKDAEVFGNIVNKRPSFNLQCWICVHAIYHQYYFSEKNLLSIRSLLLVRTNFTGLKNDGVNC